MMSLRLYNTLSRTREVFVPVDASCVRMYVCGPTLYDFIHIGNARPVIIFDILFRLLRYLYGPEKVFYVRNVTDIDDKINARALKEYPDLLPEKAIQRVTEKTYQRFSEDVHALGNLEPFQQPRATEHIPAMRSLIERLVSLGFAYVSENHVFFSPSSMNKAKAVPSYGALSRRCKEDMLLGTRVEVLACKRAPEDFVLWKPSSSREPSWSSPAGILVQGRPGWHIECSAMSMVHLLEPFGGGLGCDDPLKNIFDIHGGGIDLVFPHHENEIAQSCCALNSPRMANVWMHNGFLQVEGHKMSKSEGNFLTVYDLLETSLFGGRSWPGEVLRLSMLKTHYRDPLDFKVTRLHEALANLAFWRRSIGDVPAGPVEGEPDDMFLDCLKDDLNTWAAFDRLNDMAKKMQRKPETRERFIASLNLLGFSFPPLQEKRKKRVDPDFIHEILELRARFIEQENWEEADRIRSRLLALGIRLKDKKDPLTNSRTVTWEEFEL